MTNRLAHETSPYLLQHAQNPVDWFPWDPEALNKAAEQDRPIFLSIGYASCHWCHVMAHESFEDPDTAAFMNEHFVNVKVDREERPDLDSIYMEAVVALTGQGGWPMSVFLTPDGKPFFGGTYFPPAPRHGLPSFRQVLQVIARAWANDRQRLLATGTALVEEIARTPALTPEQSALDPNILRRASETLFREYDWQSGGWGGAPKFPHAMSIEFLLRQYHRSGDRLALEMATHALRAMARGGIFDQIGGGFHRYATDAGWLVPHFEKMLYDSALLAPSYLHAWLVSGDDDSRRTAEMTLDFILRDLRQAEGGLGSALDADSEGQEGEYYLWTVEQVREALGDDGLAEFARLAFGLSVPGNSEGRNVLARPLADDALADRLGIARSEVEPRRRQARDRLLAARAARPAPGVDDKALTCWNGLALIALAQAARILRRPDYLAAAQALASFLVTHMRPEGRWRRSWRLASTRSPAYLEDLAALGEGLLALYQADLNPHWYQTALGLGEEILDRFSDPRGGFFDTAVEESELIARPKSLQDNAMPSGNALAVHLLLRLTSFTGEARFAEPAEASLRAIQDNLARYPTAFGAWLCAFDSALGPVGQLAVVGTPSDEAFQELIQVVNRRYLPRLVIAGGRGLEVGAPALLKERGHADGGPTAYLCRGFACQLPVQEPSALERQLDEMFGPSPAQRPGSAAQR